VQERIRALHRELMKQTCGVFESQRVCEFLVLGLGSKNNKTRIEAIEVGGLAPRRHPPCCGADCTQISPGSLMHPSCGRAHNRETHVRRRQQRSQCSLLCDSCPPAKFLSDW